MLNRHHILISLVMPGFVFSGCYKGVEATDPDRPVLRVHMITVDPMSFETFIGNDFSRLLTPAGNSFVRTQEVSSDSTHSIKIRIEQIPSRNLVADVNYKPHMGTKSDHYLTVYQSKSGEQPFLVLPQSISRPPIGDARLQFVYNDVSLPDSIILRFYYGNVAETASDSCSMRRYALSTWATMNLSSRLMLQYDARDAITDRVIISRRTIPVGNSGISEDDFNIYQLTKNGSDFSFLRLF